MTKTEDMLISKVNTISDALYLSLKESIINLELPPGEKLSEAQIAKLYGVSKAPVRSVLQRLHQEGYVQIKPQSGTVIAPLISYEKARDICQIRLLLEPYAASIAARVITEEQKAPLYEFSKQCKNLKTCTKDRIVELHKIGDEKMHTLIWKLSGNQEIVSILTGYHDEMKRMQITTAKYAARIPASLKEMIEVNDALLANDSERCKEKMHVHIANLLKALETIMEK